MFAISLLQPWAWAILWAGKDIENRTWDLPAQFVGRRVMLRASKRVSRDEFDGAADMIEGVSGVRVSSYELVPMGALVGAVTFTGSIHPGNDGVRWHFPDQFCWIVHDAKPLPEPIPCKGMLGFWRIPDDVAARVRGLAGGAA
jgi:hypothetical protein